MNTLFRFIALILLAASASLAQAASISITPSSLTVNKGESFSLDINISGVSDLYGFQFDSGFNPSVLSAISVNEGLLLPSGGSTLHIPGDIDNGAGSISNIASSLDGNLSGVNGSGILETINFKAIATGSSDINLFNIILLDSAGADINIDGIENTSVLVKPAIASTPIPGAVWLFGSALVSLVACNKKKKQLV